MNHSPIDVEFARFRRTRAPEALAAVFDATAPRLLLVAMHLCRDAAAAEDLVQTVFLQAMRDADRHDGARPVLPWLLGILEHRARDLQARAWRRRERGGDPSAAQAATTPADDPSQRAADLELRHQVAAALDGLPRDYREVLTLRLVHGLRAVDIARARGVSPATVRSQLRRGLELLRRGLPRSLATPLLLGLLAREALCLGDALPTLKAQLLRTLPATAAPALAGAALAKWLLGGGALVAATLLATAVMLPWSPPPATTVLAGGGLSASATLPLSVDGPGDAAPAPRVRLPGAGGRDDRAPAATVTRLHGRVVDDRGRTLPGVQVSLRSYPAAERGDPPADWQDPPMQTTDTDGAFAFAFTPPVALAWEVKASLPRHSDAFRSPYSLRQGIDADLGDLVLHPATPVRVVVRVDDRPLRGLEVYANRVEPGGAPDTMHWAGDTDANGELDLGTCRPGRWRYDVRAPHDGPREGEFDLPLQAQPLVVRVDLQRPPPARTVSGTVVDQHGGPVEGLELRLPVPGSRMGGYDTATTAADGSFLFARRQTWEGEDRWHLQLPGKRTDLEWIENGGEFAFGAQDLRLVVRRRAVAALRLEVVDARTGAPVGAYGASCWLDTWRHGHDMPRLRRAAIEPHADGRCAFDGLAPGQYRVSVFPPPPYAERGEIAVPVREGRTEVLRVAVSPPATLQVTVRARQGGAPLAGVELALARVVPEDRLDEVDPETFLADVELLRRGGGCSSGVNAIALDRATTDRDGRAVLRAAPDQPALVLFAAGDRILAEVVRGVTLPPAGLGIEVTLDAAASVHGRVGPAEFVTRFGPAPEARAARDQGIELPDPHRIDGYFPLVELRPVPADGRRWRAHTDAGGAFAIGAVPPGRYDVFLAPRVQTSESSYATTALGPLRTIDLAVGDRELDLDAAAFVPARMAARFFVDGQPWRGRVGFARVEGGDVRPISVVTDDEGRGTARSPWLLPGRYLPFAVVPTGSSGPSDRPIYGLAPFDVRPAAVAGDRVFALQRRAVTIDLTDADGTALPDRRIVPVALDHPELGGRWRAGARTDAHGRVVFDPAPPGRLQVRAFDPDQDPTADGTEPAVALGEIGPQENRLECRWP